MARSLRIEYPGAVYHAMARGTHNDAVGAFVHLDFQVTNEEALREFCNCSGESFFGTESSRSNIAIAGWMQAIEGEGLDLGGGDLGPWYAGFPHETLIDYVSGPSHVLRDKTFISSLRCTKPNSGLDFYSWAALVNSFSGLYNPSNYKELFNIKWRYQRTHNRQTSEWAVKWDEL